MFQIFLCYQNKNVAIRLKKSCFYLNIDNIFLLVCFRGHGHLFLSADMLSHMHRCRGGCTHMWTLGKLQATSLADPSGCTGNGKLSFLAKSDMNAINTSPWYYNQYDNLFYFESDFLESIVC